LAAIPGVFYAQSGKNIEQNRLILNVEDFGATGDGITDDGPALRKLFEKASALNRPAKIIFARDAVYYLGKDEHPVCSMFLNRASDRSRGSYLCGDLQDASPGQG
jgi:hypothetical protein